MSILAFFFALVVPWQIWPITAGPYESWDACNDIRQWYEQRGYETDSCAPMPLPQADARPLRVLDIP